jgi:enamine deaminase RidA (YjgF/YER057c/UK114 family)
MAESTASLPPLPQVRGTSSPFLRTTVHDSIAYLSGQLPHLDGVVLVTGTVGGDIGLDEAKHAARLCALNALAVIDSELGGLDQVAQVLRVTGYVASAPGFSAQPAVIDAASQVLLDYLGERGRHARSAIGVAALPREAPVEVEITVALRQ